MPRKNKQKQCLKRLASTKRFALDIREVDVERSSDDDLTKSQLWDELLEQIRSKQYDVVFMSPPRNTWSRVRYQWQLHPGPRPVRNAVWPLGFPKWLNLRIILCNRVIEACRTASSVGAYFLVEHPEDLGAIGAERPASLWQLDDMRQMVLDTKSTTRGQFSNVNMGACHLVSNIPGSKSLTYTKWPSFTKLGQYIGPLPFQCGHKWHVKKLIGKSKDGRFPTAPSAAYPAGLCMFLAELISSVLRKGENELQSRDQDVSTTTTASIVADPLRVIRRWSRTRVNFLASLWVCRPLQVATWNFKEAMWGSLDPCRGSKRMLVSPSGLSGLGVRRSLLMVFGLCSPNLYRPEQRGAFLREELKILAKRLHSFVEQFVVREIGDVRDKSFRLAVGQFSESPFKKSSMDELRQEWSRLLPRPESALVVPEGQGNLLFFK